jgi:hypothetical protein
MNVDEPAAQEPAGMFFAGVLARTALPRMRVARANENLPSAFDLVEAIRCLPIHKVTVRPERHAPCGDLICPRSNWLDALRKVMRVEKMAACPPPPPVPPDPVAPPGPPPWPPDGDAVVVAVQLTVPESHGGLARAPLWV